MARKKNDRQKPFTTFYINMCSWVVYRTLNNLSDTAVEIGKFLDSKTEAKKRAIAYGTAVVEQSLRHWPDSKVIAACVGRVVELQESCNLSVDNSRTRKKYVEQAIEEYLRIKRTR